MRLNAVFCLIGFSAGICSTGCTTDTTSAYSQKILNSKLSHSVVDGQTETAKNLLAECVNANIKIPKNIDISSSMVGEPLIIVAAKRHDMEMLKALLDHGANVNAQWMASKTKECHCFSGEQILETPLIDAAAVLDVKAVKLLLERGADVRIAPGGSEGKTLLSYVRSEYPKQFTYAPGDIGGGRMPDDTNVTGRYYQVVALISASLRKQRHDTATNKV